ncbi:neck protein [Mycobacterium phage Mendokysei]|uniref:Uncharacterized protein n=1 Tax=Mycobacterium phage Mendokysei TaxID=2099637 RepID=A0A2P1CGB5_9CAUD|nr:neck protein [Mycobacterium phage Mendokysei]AVJ50229.1 hypothetical protein SEA_MENDOKYSEI_11 [Mycobacterium phage Mendokysei]
MAQVRLTNINIPEPNPAVAAVKMSPRMRGILEHIGHTAVLLYQARVAKRTRRLALSARATVEVAGARHDTLAGVVTVGGHGAGYALPHEFGADVPLFGDHEEEHEQPAAHDLNRVLEELGRF